MFNVTVFDFVFPGEREDNFVGFCSLVFRFLGSSKVSFSTMGADRLTRYARAYALERGVRVGETIVVLVPDSDVYAVTRFK